MNNKNHAPLVHISKRAALPWYGAWGIRAAAIVLALVVCSVVTTVFTGEDPIAVYAAMFEGAFGTARRTWVLLQNLAILLCISLAVTPAFKMRFWNIGAEGQVLAGALAVAACMILIGDSVPNWLLIVIMAAAGIAAGAIWAFIPAFFKARWNTNETLFTLMMNYVATQLVAYFIIIWEVPKGAGKVGIINQSTMAGWLPQIGSNKYLLNILIVAVITVLMYVYLRYSKHGYEISVVGESERTARYVGIKVERVIMRTLLLSGAICGVAGLLLVAGTDHTITTTLAGGRGFTAVMAGQVQPDLHGVHEPAAGLTQRGLQRDLHGFRPEQLLRRHTDRHHTLLHHRLRVLHQLQAELQKARAGGGKGGQGRCLTLYPSSPGPWPRAYPCSTAARARR